MAGTLVALGSTGNTGSSATITLTYTLPGGEGVFAFSRWSSTGGVTSTSLSDGTNNYAGVGADLFDGATGGSRLWYIPNSAAVTSATLTMTWSGATSFRGLGFARYSGLDNNATQANNRQAQASPGTGLNVVTSLTATPSAQPNMFFGVSQSGQTLTAGTSPLLFTDDGTFTSMNSGAGITSRVESANTSATTASAATFGMVVSDVTHAHVGVVGQSGGGGATRPVKMAGEWGGYAGSSGGFAGKQALLHEGLYLPWDGLHVPPRVFQLMAEVRHGIYW